MIRSYICIYYYHYRCLIKLIQSILPETIMEVENSGKLMNIVQNNTFSLEAGGWLVTSMFVGGGYITETMLMEECRRWRKTAVLLAARMIDVKLDLRILVDVSRSFRDFYLFKFFLRWCCAGNSWQNSKLCKLSNTYIKHPCSDFGSAKSNVFRFQLDPKEQKCINI